MCDREMYCLMAFLEVGGTDECWLAPSLHLLQYIKRSEGEKQPAAAGCLVFTYLSPTASPSGQGLFTFRVPVRFYARRVFRAAATFRLSPAASCPSLRKMKRLSRVNNFILTSDLAVRPAVTPSEISTSSGQLALPALVIIAKTLCPDGALKAFALDMTSAGLLLTVAESVNGKGTTTMSKRS